MSETRFTPGPWIVRGGTRIARVYKDEQGRRCTRFIGTAFAFAGHPDSEEPEYNSHLIAAAPELYAALDVMRFQLEACNACLKTWNITGSPLDAVGAMLMADAA